MSLRTLFVVPILCVSGFANGADIPTEQQALAQKVVTLCRANAQAVHSVECDYSFFIDDGLQRKCRYARDADKYYHASVDLYANGARGLAREVTWDGQVARSRPSPHLFNQSIDKNDAKPSCETPDQAVASYLQELFDAVDGRSEVYTLVGAKTARVNGEDCIELEFASKRSKGKAFSRHSRDRRYLPTWVMYVDGQGRPQNEIPAVDYERREIDGNVLFFPVQVIRKVFVEGRQEDLERFQVEPKTLRLNHPVAVGRFAIEPWPSDYVVDLNTLKQTQPRDLEWSPVGKLGFPYNVFYEKVKPENAKNRMGLSASASAASGQNSNDSRRGTSSPSAAISPPIGSEVTAPARAWWWLVAIGMLVGATGVAWAWRQRRVST